MKIDRGKEFYQERLIHFSETGTQAGINAAVIMRDIEYVMRDQAALITEGRSLMAVIDDYSKKQQISGIINMLNAELQHSSKRLEALIARLNSA